jgi:hypothetical protein
MQDVSFNLNYDINLTAVVIISIANRLRHVYFYNLHFKYTYLLFTLFTLYEKVLREKNDVDILTDLHILNSHEYETVVFEILPMCAFPLPEMLDAFFLFGIEELIVIGQCPANVEILATKL